MGQAHRRGLGARFHPPPPRKTKKHKQRYLTPFPCETYLMRGGFEIQVNAVDNADLRDAQEHPDEYRDLVVRVAGYSDYFVNLAENIQNEVIARSEFNVV